MANKKTKIAILTLCFIVFVTFVGLSLKTSGGYALPFGWSVDKSSFAPPASLNIPPDNIAVCDRTAVERGFPFTVVMPHDDESDCYDQNNLTALILDILAAMTISVGIGWFIIQSIGTKYKATS